MYQNTDNTKIRNKNGTCTEHSLLLLPPVVTLSLFSNNRFTTQPMQNQPHLPLNHHLTFWSSFWCIFKDSHHILLPYTSTQNLLPHPLNHFLPSSQLPCQNQSQSPVPVSHPRIYPCQRSSSKTCPIYPSSLSFTTLSPNSPIQSTPCHLLLQQPHLPPNLHPV